jgi:hypothetical protein
MRSQSEHHHSPAPEEWDFRAVPDDELLPCAYWEYARESARIRASFMKEASDFFPAPDIQSEIRTPDGRVFMKARRRLVEPLRMRFAERILRYAVPIRTTFEKATSAAVSPEALDHPWQNLPEIVRRETVQELAPYFAEKPALTFLPFNRCSDLRDIGLADDDYRCAERDSEAGIERLRVQIDWAEFTDAQIVEAFRIWVKENRPRGFGRADDRGKRKTRGYGNYLTWLGILRLMHCHPYTSIGTTMPKAKDLYRSADWPRARKDAGRVFCTLFPFLPKEDKPIHWKTAGGRTR